jgi:hypothetical protein
VDDEKMFKLSINILGFSYGLWLFQSWWMALILMFVCHFFASVVVKVMIYRQQNLQMQQDLQAVKVPANDN